MRQHSPAIMDCAEEPHSRHPAPGKYVAKLLTYGYVWENKINAVAFNGNIRDAMTKKKLLVMSDGVFVPYATFNRIRVGPYILNLSPCDVSRATTA